MCLMPICLLQFQQMSKGYLLEGFIASKKLTLAFKNGWCKKTQL